MMRITIATVFSLCLIMIGCAPLPSTPSAQESVDDQAARRPFPMPGLAVAHDGTVYAADFRTGDIYTVNPDDGAVESLVSGTELESAAPFGIAVAPDRSLYWTEVENDVVCRKGDGNTIQCQSMPEQVGPLAFCRYGRLFAGVGKGYSTLYEVDPALTAPPRRIFEFSSPVGHFAFCGEPWLCVPLPEHDGIMRVDVTASEPEPEILLSDLAAPRSVDLDPYAGLCIVVSLDDERDGIVRFDRIQGTTETLVTMPNGLGQMVVTRQDRRFFNHAIDGDIYELMPDGAVRRLQTASQNE